MAFMNSLSIRLLSLVAFAALCATLAYWVITLVAQRPAPPDAVAVRAPVPVDAAGTLFGGQIARAAATNLQLSGILALPQGAAAIISEDGAPSRAVAVGMHIDANTTLAEVRARSIVIDRHGARSEVFLPANTAGSTIYVR